MYSCSYDLENFPPIGKIQILSRSKTKEFTHDKPWAAISIDTFDEWPKLNKCQQIGLLQISFADANINPEIGKLFNQSHAEQILDFVQEYWDKIDLLLIHCYAGKSRSPGVGAAIAKIFTGDDNTFYKWYTPNSLVYSTILKAAFERGMLGSLLNRQPIPSAD